MEWERQSKWDYKLAAIKGSSFLKLPAIFQWFTGNIGFHHVHHLSSRIPNYNLARCHYENEIFNNVKPVLFISTFRAINLGLWDETNHVLVSFRKFRISRLKEEGIKFLQKKQIASAGLINNYDQALASCNLYSKLYQLTFYFIKFLSV